MHFSYAEDLAIIDSSLKCGISNSIEVISTQIPVDHFGFAFLVPFYSGCVTTVSLYLKPQNSKDFRIEVDGFTSRMQKAYIEFDDFGQIKVMGEEILACSIEHLIDGNLNINFQFVPHKTRLAHLYIYSKNNLTERHDAPLSFICQSLSLEFELLHDNNLEDISRRVTPLGTMVSINALFQFKNYLQIDFEILRPNLALCGLRLIGPCQYETIQWWTNDRVVQNLDSQIVGHEFLEPRPTLLTLPSPTVMAILGPQYGFCGHRINALYFDLHDQRLSLQPDSDYIVKQLQLEALFEDGSIELIPIIEDVGNHFLQLSIEFKYIDFYSQNCVQSLRPVFLELGARGPRSQLVRKKVSSTYQYIGLDTSPGENVDLVGDAHKLTELFDLESIDIIYSDDVLEHLINPFVLVNQANQILKMGGLFIAKVPTTWPLHAEPCDYWRFSTHAWKSLLNSRSGFEVLGTREIGSASVVPSTIDPLISANTQYAPAPLFTVVLAKKISISLNAEGNLNHNEFIGSYDHWGIGSRYGG